MMLLWVVVPVRELLWALVLVPVVVRALVLGQALTIRMLITASARLQRVVRRQRKVLVGVATAV